MRGDCDRENRSTVTKCAPASIWGHDQLWSCGHHSSIMPEKTLDIESWGQGTPRGDCLGLPSNLGTTADKTLTAPGLQSNVPLHGSIFAGIQFPIPAQLRMTGVHDNGMGNIRDPSFSWKVTEAERRYILSHLSRLRG